MAILTNIFNRYGDYFMPPTDNNKPAYHPINRRGHWSYATLDFFFGCLAPTFGTLTFSELPVYILLFGGGISIRKHLHLHLQIFLSNC